MTMSDGEKKALAHGMNCPCSVMGTSQTECTCGLMWREKLLAREIKCAQYVQALTKVINVADRKTAEFDFAKKVLRTPDPQADAIFAIVQAVINWSEQKSGNLNETFEHMILHAVAEYRASHK